MISCSNPEICANKLQSRPKLRQNCDIFGPPIFSGEEYPKFLMQFYKLQSPSNMYQSLVTIGQETSEIRRREKGLNTSSISQWPSASQMTGGHNKTGKADHSAKKLAANIPYIIGNLCSKFGGNWFIFKEVTTKRSMDPSSRTRDWPPSVLNLRRLWPDQYSAVSYMLHPLLLTA